jgi:hypothetical protein
MLDVDFARRHSTYLVNNRKEYRPTMATSYVRATASADRPRFSISLWIAQVLLALVFVMSGGMKLLLPADVLQASTPLPIELVRFIGVCEVAGALGMILPGLLRIQTRLTALAALGLLVLMVCATVLTPILIGPDPVLILLPLTMALLAAFVAFGRTRLVPLRPRA